MDNTFEKIPNRIKNNHKIDEMIEYLNYAIKDLNIVILERINKSEKNAFYVEPRELYEENLIRKENNLTTIGKKNVVTCWQYADRIELTIKPYFKPKPFVNKSELEEKNIKTIILQKYSDLLDNINKDTNHLDTNKNRDRKGVSTEGFHAVLTIETVDKEAEALIDETSDGAINAKINTFQHWISMNKENEAKQEQKRKKFVDDYKIKTIIDMKKEEYVVGLGRQDTFCYRLETELKELGDIHGSPSVKFGMYYGKNGKDVEIKYRIVKSKFGEDPDEALEKIKKQIVMLIMAGEKKDYKGIKACILAPIFKGKILSTFYSEIYLGIFANEHLEYFLNRLNIPFSNCEDELDKQLKLLSWKENNSVLNDCPNHTFERFLYTSFGNPAELGRAAKDEQEEKDKNYPRVYPTKVDVNIDQWEELLLNQEVFLEKDIKLIKRIYLSENHAATCYELGIEDGVSPSTYIRPVVELGRRISDKLNLNPIIRPDGSEVWWCIPFWGSYRVDDHFEWKVRPKLAKALISIYPELDLFRDNEEEDSNLIEDLKKATVKKEKLGYEYKGKPKKKQNPVYSNGRKTYPRNRQTALNALAHSFYECEIDVDHPTFKRKKADVNYTEPHHLVPMAYSDSYEVCLDREQNIVSLCSNCHNHLHYGKGAEEMLKKLFDERKEVLLSVGIEITIEGLIKMYK